MTDREKAIVEAYTGFVMLTGKEAILAEYREKGKPEWTIWFLTEADRSITTILFPEDFAILMG